MASSTVDKLLTLYFVLLMRVGYERITLNLFFFLPLTGGSELFYEQTVQFGVGITLQL